MSITGHLKNSLRTQQARLKYAARKKKFLEATCPSFLGEYCIKITMDHTAGENSSLQGILEDHTHRTILFCTYSQMAYNTEYQNNLTRRVKLIYNPYGNSSQYCANYLQHIGLLHVSCSVKEASQIKVIHYT